MMRIDRVIVLGVGASETPVMAELIKRFPGSALIVGWDGMTDLPDQTLVVTPHLAVVPPPHSLVLPVAAALACPVKVH